MKERKDKRGCERDEWKQIINKRMEMSLICSQSHVLICSCSETSSEEHEEPVHVLLLTLPSLSPHTSTVSPIYGLLNPNVTPDPQSADLEAPSIWGRPFPDSIKEAAELRDTKKQKWRGRIINCWHNGGDCAPVGPSTSGGWGGVDL